MGSNRKMLLIVVLLVAGFFLFRYLLFEKKDVVVLKNGQTFQDNKKVDEGLWLFRRMLEADSFKVTNVASFEEIEEWPDSSWIIHFSENFFADEFLSVEMLELAERGNTLLLPAYNHRIEMDSVQYYGDAIGWFNHVSIWMEGRLFDFPLFEKSNDQFYTQTRRTNPLPEEFWTLDTLLTADFSSKAESYDSLQSGALSCVEDQAVLLMCSTIGKGKICFHYVPYLFTNIASEQEGFLPHYQSVVKSMSKNDILFIDPTMTEDSDKSQSPLQYILQEPSFKWAYYLSWVTALVFLIMGAKRINPPIPIVPKKKNDMIKYVKTISRLFQKNEAHHVMGKKMENNFFKYVNAKYFLHREDPDFWERLATKSRIDKAHIFRIRNTFEHNRNLYDYTTEVLKQQYQLLDQFYKTAQ